MQAGRVDERVVDRGADDVASAEQVRIHRSRIAGHSTEFVSWGYRRTGTVEHLLLAVRHARVRLRQARLQVVLKRAERAVRGQVEQQHAVRRQLLEAARQEDEQLMNGRLIQQVSGFGEREA